MARYNWVRIVSLFLSISYGLGAPATAFVEYHNHFFSMRFGYSPELIYVMSAAQFACAIGLLVRSWAPWAAACLTATTLGAMYSHFHIGAPAKAIPAFLYTVLQVWYALQVSRRS